MLKEKNIKILLLIIFIAILNTNKVISNNSYNFLFDNYHYNTFKLFIPKISLFKSFNENSTLEDNIKLHEKSILSNEKSTIIILGHSGYSKNAFFNDLSVLKIGDDINFYYGNKLYFYKVQKIEYITKGHPYKIEFSKDNLYLITCSLTDFSKQIIINSKKIKTF